MHNPFVKREGRGCGFGDALRKETNLTAEDTAAAAMRFRNTQGCQWLKDLLKDLRYCLRRLRRATGFALTTIVVTALGIGAATAIYAFVDATLVKPLPYLERRDWWRCSSTIRWATVFTCRISTIVHGSSATMSSNRSMCTGPNATR